MMTTEAPVPTESSSGALRRVLGFGDGLGTSVSSMAPTFTIGVSLGSLAAIVGTSMVVFWAVAILPMLAVAGGFVALNRRDPRAGTAYTWAGEHLHPLAGFMAGWLMVGGFTVFLGYAVQALGATTLQVLQTLGLVGADEALAAVPAAVIGVGWLALLGWLAVRGVDVAARMQKVVIAVDLVVVVGLCGWALVHGGGEPVSAEWFNPFAVGSLTTFVNGLVATTYLYWGWDNALRLNEETRDGGGSAGRAAGISLLVVVAVFMFCQVGIQHVTTQDELVAQGANGLVFVADRLAGDTGALLAGLALLLSIVAIVQAILLSVTRQTLAMSRDGVLGPLWGRLHPTHGTPVAGTAALGLVVTAIVAVNVTLGSLAEVIGGAIMALGMLATAYYAICALAVVAAFRGRTVDARQRLTTVVLPLVSAVVLTGLTAWSLVSNWRLSEPLAMSAANGRFYDVVAVGIVLLGLPVVLLARRRGSAYFRRTPARAS